MKTKHWFTGAVIGIITGLLVGTGFAYYHWQLNPGGIFRGDQGTNWIAIWETIISWWWPVALWLTGIYWVIMFILSRLSRRKNVD